jgi:hypothetical protein
MRTKWPESYKNTFDEHFLLGYLLEQVNPLPCGYLECLGQESTATTILFPLSVSACLVSILILGIFFSAGTKMCLVVVLLDPGLDTSMPQYWRHFLFTIPTTRAVGYNKENNPVVQRQ